MIAPQRRRGRREQIFFDLARYTAKSKGFSLSGKGGKTSFLIHLDVKSNDDFLSERTKFMTQSRSRREWVIREFLRDLCVSAVRFLGSGHDN